MKQTTALSRRLAVFCLAGIASLTFSIAAFAAYPDKPIKMIVPWPPGGASDLVARAYSKRLAERLGQPIVIDNRAGAAGMIGTDAAVKAAPDGYTLVWIADSYLVSPHVSPSTVKYDPRKDFTDVGLVGMLPFVMVVNTEKNGGNLLQFIDKAKKAPGMMTYSSWGIGSASHLSMELFMTQTGIKMNHIPYQGAAPATTAVIGGQVDTLLVPLPVALPHHRGGKAQILGVASPRRFAGASDLPTLAEQGVAATLGSWMAVLGPAKMPADVVTRLATEMAAISEEPEMRETLVKMGVDPTHSSPQELSKMVASEFERWGRVVREAKVEIK